MTEVGEAVAVYGWAPAIPDEVEGQLLIPLPDGFEISEDWWEQTREANRHVRIELVPNRKLRCAMVSMSGGRITFRMSIAMGSWFRSAGGEGFDSATAYDLPAGFRKYPDGAWVSEERIPEHAKPPYPDTYEIIPDFIYEVRSPKQSVELQHEKMLEWIAGGVRLGWLIDPFERTVRIYRENGDVELLEDPAELSGEDVCVGLVVDLAWVWDQSR